MQVKQINTPLHTSLVTLLMHNQTAFVSVPCNTQLLVKRCIEVCCCFQLEHKSVLSHRLSEYGTWRRPCSTTLHHTCSSSKPSPGFTTHERTNSCSAYFCTLLPCDQHPQHANSLARLGDLLRLRLLLLLRRVLARRSLLRLLLLLLLLLWRRRSLRLSRDLLRRSFCLSLDLLRLRLLLRLCCLRPLVCFSRFSSRFSERLQGGQQHQCCQQITRHCLHIILCASAPRLSAHGVKFIG
jgi:hypothetical protein